VISHLGKIGRVYALNAHRPMAVRHPAFALGIFVVRHLSLWAWALRKYTLISRGLSGSSWCLLASGSISNVGNHKPITNIGTRFCRHFSRYPHWRPPFTSSVTSLAHLADKSIYDPSQIENPGFNLRSTLPFVGAERCSRCSDFGMKEIHRSLSFKSHHFHN